jgi:hypothetical protein
VVIAHEHLTHDLHAIEQVERHREVGAAIVIRKAAIAAPGDDHLDLGRRHGERTRAAIIHFRERAQARSRRKHRQIAHAGTFAPSA